MKEGRATTVLNETKMHSFINLALYYIIVMTTTTIGPRDAHQ
jgi:hypothetical protein